VDGKARYQLSDLMRGQKGTETFIDGHSAGDAFLLLDAAVRRVSVSSGNIGDSIPFSIRGRDGTVTAFNETTEGANLMPYAVTAFEGEQSGADWVFTWTPRGPVAITGYAVEIYDGATLKRTLNVTSPTVTYTSAQQTTDFGSAVNEVTLRVFAVNSYGRGYGLDATVESPDLGFNALGAGAPGIDGDYLPDGTFGGRTRYVNVDYALAWWDDVDGTGWVLIDTAYLSGFSSYFDAYAFGPNDPSPVGSYDISGLPGSTVEVTAL
jgi:hypothetical protein